MTIALSQIRQIAVTVRNLDRALVFYRDRLGMKFLFQAGALAFFDCGGVRLMLSVPEKPEFDHPTSILYFDVADIHAATAALGGEGVKFESQPQVIARMPAHDVWLAMFRDSENNLLGLMSELPRA